MQHWFNPTEPAQKKLFYKFRSLRQFLGIDRGCELAADETTI